MGSFFPSISVVDSRPPPLCGESHLIPTEVVLLMRVKLLTMGAVSVVACGLLIGQAAASAPSPQNANKSAAKKPAKAATPAKPAAGATPAAGGGAAAPATPAAKKPVHHRAHKPAGGVPTGGVGACAERLGKLAEKDPLVPYEGQPSEIVNNGLLWNDPHSKCAVTDQALKDKVFSLATAWREGKADQVRSLIGEIKAAAPAPEMKPAAHKRHKKA